MRNFLISAAILAFIGGTSLAIAQDRGHDGGPRGGGQQMGGREGGSENRAPRPTPQAAPQGQPHFSPMDGRDSIGARQFREHHDAPSPARTERAAPQPNAVGGNNFSRDSRDSGRDRRDNNDFRRNNESRGNSGSNFNRPGNAMRDNRRHDFSNFRNYHQNFRAPHRFRAAPYRRPPGYFARRWSWGQTLPVAFWARDYWLTDFYAYDLPPPPYGAIWVRVGDDALLIDQDSGEIIEVDYGVFY